MTKGIGSRNRSLLERLHRAHAGPFTVGQAAEALGLERVTSAKLVAYLADRGWLSRVRRGLYITVPLGATEPSKWRADPWIVASRVFPPCYIGGWTACEHWSLTEQLFRDIVVITSRATRTTEVVLQGTRYRLKHLSGRKLFGTSTVWRGADRVSVSDPSRTMVDILDDPSIGGGIRHIASVLPRYWNSEHRDEARLLEYSKKRGNRTVFKRLGFLLEALDLPASAVIRACQKGISSGLTLLDPTVKRKGRIVTRWNLRVNVDLTRESLS